MPVKADFELVVKESISSSSEDGSEIEGEHWVVPVLIPVSEVAALLADYDHQNGNHPLAVTAKPIAKSVLEALRLKS
jgi:hypothetical protein